MVGDLLGCETTCSSETATVSETDRLSDQNFLPLTVFEYASPSPSSFLKTVATEVADDKNLSASCRDVTAFLCV